MITLESKILEIKSIKKKTQAIMFKDLKIGDKIKISVDLTCAGGGYRGTYAKYIAIENIKTEEYVAKSFNELPKILDCFELVIID